MHGLRTPLPTLACLGLLGSQISGLHTHMNADGYVGTPEGTHVHGAEATAHRHAHGDGVDTGHPPHPDHEGDRDVSLVELGAAFPKLQIFIASPGIGPAVAFAPAGAIRIDAAVLPQKRRRDRWRPPLRAPPLLSH